jgi:Kdo2-lipid IVA lauroyltransferase/acyltransferase
MAERRRLWRGFGDLAEAAGAALLFGLFRLLPLDWASATGGFLARRIGPQLGISARARQNLHRAMPELAPPEIAHVVSGMWDNLGRVIAE